MASQGLLIKYCVISDWSFSPGHSEKHSLKVIFWCLIRNEVAKQFFFNEVLIRLLLYKSLFHKTYGNLATLKSLCICQIYFTLTNGLKLFFPGKAWNIPSSRTQLQSDYKRFSTLENQSKNIMVREEMKVAITFDE